MLKFSVGRDFAQTWIPRDELSVVRKENISLHGYQLCCQVHLWTKHPDSPAERNNQFLLQRFFGLQSQQLLWFLCLPTWHKICHHFKFKMHIFSLYIFTSVLLSLHPCCFPPLSTIPLELSHLKSTVTQLKVNNVFIHHPPRGLSWASYCCKTNI